MQVISERELCGLDLVGRPFAYGGRGPDSFDCYGLVMWLHKELDNVAIPDYRTPETGVEIQALMGSEIAMRWERSESEGRMLYIRLHGSAHVGYDLGDGRFMHVWERSGGVRIEDKAVWQKAIVSTYKYIQ